MSEDIAEGNKDKAEGKIREGVGKLTGDKEEEAHGKLDQAKGEIKKNIGKAKQEV